MSAHVSRFGPNPATKFYQLDEDLLWAHLKPVEKLLLMDLFHRERKGAKVPTLEERAKLLDVSHDTLQRAEERLERAGYLLIHRRKGLASRYLAAYPARPLGSSERAAFEQEFAGLCAADEPQERTLKVTQIAFTQDTQNACGSTRKMRVVDTQTACATQNDSLFLVPKNKEEGEIGRPPVPPPPPAAPEPAVPPAFSASPEGAAEALHLRALRVFRAAEDRLFTFFGTLPTPRNAEAIVATLEKHLASGRTPTPEQWQRACEGAGVWAERKNNGRRTVGALLQELALVLGAVERTGDRQRQRERDLGRAAVQRDGEAQAARQVQTDARSGPLWQTLLGGAAADARLRLASVTAAALEGEGEGAALVCRVDGTIPHEWLSRRAARLTEAAREQVREFPEVVFRLAERAPERPGGNRGKSGATEGGSDG